MVYPHPLTKLRTPTFLTTRENEDQAVFWLFRVSYLWYSALGCLATILTGLLVSVATGVRDPTSVPIDLISPPVVALLNSLPDSMKVRTRLFGERGLKVVSRKVKIKAPSLHLVEIVLPPTVPTRLEWKL